MFFSASEVTHIGKAIPPASTEWPGQAASGGYPMEFPFKKSIKSSTCVKAKHVTVSAAP